ncbi:MAG: alanine:cation symporter family protein, partial [Acidaminococcaceae bacterium]|nr:alanine:cation symporter family protein [Acidaminococcaceae bacterium]
IVTFMLTLCFCLFAYTCLIGMITFPEIAAARISKSRACVIVVRCICLAVAAFGIVVNIAGYDLGNLWAFSDLANILIVYANIPNLYLGLKYVVKATEHYRLQGDRNFTGEVLGSKMAKYCVCWQKNK